MKTPVEIKVSSSIDFSYAKHCIPIYICRHGLYCGEPIHIILSLYKMHGKVFAITGGASGIGLALAKKLLA
jgi:hypothetical protein